MNELPPLPAPAQPPKTSGLAITSLVLGILSLTCFWLLTAIPAVICGHVAHGRIKRSLGALQGSGLALAGLITGYISIALSVLVIPMLLAIAIPNFVKARDTAQRHACQIHLRQIEDAKSSWALENKKNAGDKVDEAQVRAVLSPSTLTCPKGGVYSFNAVGTAPTCSIPGHQLSE